MKPSAPPHRKPGSPSPPPRSKARAHPAHPEVHWIHSTRVHLVLFSMLLVATPLVMLRNFLQQGISKLSNLKLPVFGFELPLVLSLVVVAAVTLLIVYRKQLGVRHLIAAGVAVLMIALGQQVTDYYSDHRFYDLQQNWHYIAYGMFAFMMYRDLAPRGTPLPRIFLITFCCALLYSMFDEAFQKYINTRVFDISDIAKDAYGSVAGMVVLTLSGAHRHTLAADRRLRHARLIEYLRHPFSTLLIIFSFTFLLLMFGSLLSDDPYFLTALLISLGTLVFLWLAFHLTQFRVPRIILLVVFAAAIATQGYFLNRYWGSGIMSNRYGLTVYNGVPIPFFDVMIFPDGGFRLVDKKHEFNFRDRTFLLKQKTDILLISSGALGKGGNGFSSKAPSQFAFNPFTLRGTHVIILDNKRACDTFNRLKRDHKNVLFILHNTC